MATLLDEIRAQTQDVVVQKAMIMASYLEGVDGPNKSGGWPCNPTTDNLVCGPFQINRSPGTPQVPRGDPNVTLGQSQDPHFAVSYMLPRFQRCRNGVSGSGADDLAQIVHCAESGNPTQNYRADYTEANVQNAYSKASTVATDTSGKNCPSFLGISQLPDGSCVWSGIPGIDQSGGAVTPQNPIQGVQDTATAISNVQATLTDPHTWVRMALVAIGIVLIIGGVHAFTGIGVAV